MHRAISEDVHALILPAFAGAELSDAVKHCLDRGGVSILLGETREEYVARRMTDARRASETPEMIRRVTAKAKARAGRLIAAVDQEMGGTCRLHDLVPPFPIAEDLPSASPEEIEAISFAVGEAAAGMGVNGFLAPVLDLLTGRNPWLHGRTYSTDPVTVGQLSAAFVRGVQRAGVAATAKHFPGFHDIALDPAIEAEAKVVDPADAFEAGFGPFRDVIADNVQMIMIGPAIVTAFDPKKPALRSRSIVDRLKTEFGFQGVVMADGLDAAATRRGDPIEQVAIDAVNAGCDFLLVGDIDNQIARVADALIEAADNGTVSADGVARAASKIRAVADRYAAPI